MAIEFLKIKFHKFTNINKDKLQRYLGNFIIIQSFLKHLFKKLANKNICDLCQSIFKNEANIYNQT